MSTGQYGWPSNDEEFLTKFEKLKQCQRHLQPDKSLSTLGERGALIAMQRPIPDASVFRSTQHLEGEQAQLTTREHWTDQTPRNLGKRRGAEDESEEKEGEDEDGFRFATGMSKRSIRTWGEVMSGYLALGYYLVFFFLFISFLLSIYRPAEMFLVNNHIRGAVLREDSELSTIKDLNSFWAYLLGEAESEEPFEKKYLETGEEGAHTKGGLLGMIFTSQHYNNQMMQGEELGFDNGMMGKVVGGVLIVQERVEASINNKSLYGPWFNKAEPVNAPVSKAPFGVALANGSAVELGVIPESETAPFLILQADAQVQQLRQAFTYSEQYGGYAHLFVSGQGRDAHLEFGWLLRAKRWIDRQTSAIRIKFAVYNGNLGLFIYCNLNLVFLRAGSFDRTDVTPYTIKLNGVQLEPGRRKLGDSMLECVFVGLVGAQVYASGV